MGYDSKITLLLAKGKNSSYFQEVRQELKKVTWTTREELVTCTKIVIGATFILGIGIYLAGLLIRGILELVALLVRLIFG